MFKNSKFIAAGLLSVSAALTSFAQETPKPPTAPREPLTIERDFQIFTGGSGSYLGIQSQDVTKENFSKYGLREVRGVAVEKVMENSPAAQAGFQNGDVIVRFNGEEVTSARKLTRLISEVAPDHQAEATVLRGGSEKKLNVTVGKRPTPSFEDGNFTFTAPEPFRGMSELPRTMPFPPATITTPNGGDRTFYMFRGDSRRLGIGATPLNKQLGDYFGVSDGKGVLINNVAENSAASKAGLKAGDVIVEVDGKAVANQVDLTRLISEKKEGEVTLTIIRNKNRQTVKATPEKSTGESFTFETVPTGQPREFRRLIRPTPNGGSTPMRIQ
jgi:serine protease Do